MFKDSVGSADLVLHYTAEPISASQGERIAVYL
jgi:hypothetical protein